MSTMQTHHSHSSGDRKNLRDIEGERNRIHGAAYRKAQALTFLNWIQNVQYNSQTAITTTTTTTTYYCVLVCKGM